MATNTDCNSQIPAHFTHVAVQEQENWLALTPRSGPVRPEPVLSVLRTDVFHLSMVQTDRSVLTNGKRS